MCDLKMSTVGKASDVNSIKQKLVPIDEHFENTKK